MAVSFQSVQDALFAFITVAGIGILFTLAVIASAGLSARDKARNRRAHEAWLASSRESSPVLAQHPTASDDRELVLR